jgi:predicted nucleic acid-binding protein
MSGILIDTNAYAAFKRGDAEAVRIIQNASTLAKGQPIPTNALWIAASALQHGLAVFTYDGHFGFVDGVVSGSTASVLGLS